MKKQLSIIVSANYLATKRDGMELFDNTEELDKYLKDGWRVVLASPMGGGPGGESGVFALLLLW